jgi:CHASE3 domain sensor protein
MRPPLAPCLDAAARVIVPFSTGAPLSEKVATAAADLVIGFAIGSLVNQETGVRGFALSANESFLQPYIGGLAEQRDADATLRGLLAAVPGGRRHLAAATRLIGD